MSTREVEDIIAKIEFNSRSIATMLPLVLPDSELKENKGVLAFSTNVPFAGGNGVISSKIDPVDLDEAIRQTQDYFRSKKVPILWMVSPSDEPANLGAELERYGFVKVHEHPWMAVKLEDVPLEMPVLPGVEIVKCEDLESLLKGTKVFVEVFEAPAFMQRPFAETTLKINEKKVGQQICYLALLDGRPVGTSMGNLTPDGVVGIYNVTTLEDARRRGIGRALTLQPLIEARQLGYNLGVLGASEMGYHIYQSLGFKEYCKIGVYFWQPEEIMPVPTGE